VSARTTCPHPDCENSIPREVFACRMHWFSLPKELRSEIWANFRSGEIGRILDGYEKAQQFCTAP
jgi:hypothetical protein